MHTHIKEGGHGAGSIKAELEVEEEMSATLLLTSKLLLVCAFSIRAATDKDD